jgi:hypothetical protein
MVVSYIFGNVELSAGLVYQIVDQYSPHVIAGE